MVMTICISILRIYIYIYKSKQGGSSPNPSPTKKPTTKSPTQTPAPVSSPGNSGGTTIRIKQNQGVSGWWYAVEFPDGDINKVQSIEFKDNKHSSWITGSKLDWGAYEFAHGGVQFSGKQSFRIKIEGTTFTNSNVFNGISGNSIATLSSGSSFTEEDTDGNSGLGTAGLAAIIIVVLLAIACIVGGCYYYKKHWNKNKGEASFKSTGTDTPQSKGTTNDNKEAEIEVEMNVEYTNETAR